MKTDLKLKLFRGFADPSRLNVLESLLDGPRCVSDLVKSTGLMQTNVSMHLACLRDCGLVHSQRNGRYVHYRLADRGVVQLLQAAERLVARVSRRIQACPNYEGDGKTHVKGTKPKR